MTQKNRSKILNNSGYSILELSLITPIVFSVIIGLAALIDYNIKIYKLNNLVTQFSQNVNLKVLYAGSALQGLFVYAAGSNASHLPASDTAEVQHELALQKITQQLEQQLNLSGVCETNPCPQNKIFVQFQQTSLLVHPESGESFITSSHPIRQITNTRGLLNSGFPKDLSEKMEDLAEAGTGKPFVFALPTSLYETPRYDKTKNNEGKDNTAEGQYYGFYQSGGWASPGQEVGFPRNYVRQATFFGAQVAVDITGTLTAKVVACIEKGNCNIFARQLPNDRVVLHSKKIFGSRKQF